MVQAILVSRYHPGTRVLTYSNVVAFQFKLLKAAVWPPFLPGCLGDWIVDEVTISDTGLIVHEVLYSNGGVWRVECETFSYSVGENDPDQGD
jgi:hypothetical protein